MLRTPAAAIASASTASDVLVLLGYDPAAIPERTQVTTGSGVEFVPRIELLKVEALGQTPGRFSTLCHTLPPSATAPLWMESWVWTSSVDTD